MSASLGSYIQVYIFIYICISDPWSHDIMIKGRLNLTIIIKNVEASEYHTGVKE